MPPHKQGRTTPTIREKIAASSDPFSTRAPRYNATVAMIYKWETQNSSQDLSSFAHQFQTILTHARGTIAKYLRHIWLLALDDILAVTRKYLYEGFSRSAFSRCIRTNGEGDMSALKPKIPSLLLALKFSKNHVLAFWHRGTWHATILTRGGRL